MEMWKLFTPKEGTKYGASLVANSSQKQEGYKTVSKNHDTCRTYIYRLQDLLWKDGFTDIHLDVLPCYDEYDVVKYSGLFSAKPVLVREKTNNLMGYVIKVSIQW